MKPCGEFRNAPENKTDGRGTKPRGRKHVNRKRGMRRTPQAKGQRISMFLPMKLSSRRYFHDVEKDRRSFPPDEKTSSSVLRSNYAVQLNSAGNTAGMRLADRNASAFFLRTDGPAGKGLSSIRTAEHVNQLNIQTT